MKGERPVYSAGDLAKLVNGVIMGNPNLIIKGVAGINESTPDTITFAENDDYLKKAENSDAGVVIVSSKVTDSSKTVIKTNNPRLAFAKIAQFYEPDIYYHPSIHPTAVIAKTVAIGQDVSIHPRVVIDDNAQIGDNVQLAPGVYVGKNVIIGDNTVIHPNVVLEYNTIIGANVIIHGGVVIGADGYGFVSDKEGHHKIPQLGNVIIEDNVEVGANVTIDRGTSGPTVVKRGTKIDNLVQIGHNSKIGEENLIVAQVGVAGSSTLGKRVTLAGQVGVAGHLKIGDNSTIMAGSLVTKDLEQGAICSGNPAHDHREELREQAAKRKMPELLKRIRMLEKKLNCLEGEDN